MSARAAIERLPRRADFALHLAALHRDVDRADAGVAADDLEARAEHLVECAWEDAGVLRDRGGADHDLALHRLLDAAHRRRGVPDRADRDSAGRAADPVEPRWLEVRLRQLEQWRQHEAAGDEAPGGAVLRTDALDEGGRLDAAGAWHVRDHDVGIARNVFPDHRRERRRIGA